MTMWTYPASGKKEVWFRKNADVSEMMERPQLRPTYLKMIGTHIKTEVLRKTLEDSFWDSDHWWSDINSEKLNFSKVLLDCRGLEIERFFPKAEIRFPRKARFSFHRIWKKKSRTSRINGTKMLFHKSMYLPLILKEILPFC